MLASIQVGTLRSSDTSALSFATARVQAPLNMRNLHHLKLHIVDNRSQTLIHCRNAIKLCPLEDPIAFLDHQPEALRLGFRGTI